MTAAVDGATMPEPGYGQPLALIALTAVGSAALALGTLWAWQSWSTRSAAPIDDALPMLVAVGPTTAPDDEPSPGVGAAAPTVVPTQVTAGERSASEAGEAGMTDPADSELGTIVVHVSGAVLDAGVVELAKGARVYEAVEAAGGAGSDADLDRVNLAAPLVDGERIHVPAVGEEEPPQLVPSVRPAAGQTGDMSGSVVSVTPTPVVVDLNRASALELEALPGVGPATAQAIVSTRDARGPFYAIDELLEVPGIGPAKLEQLRPYVWVQAP